MSRFRQRVTRPIVCSSSVIGSSYNGLTPDYFISTTGSDSNDGLTPATAWAITGINTKRATYGGKVLGILDGTYDLYAAVNATGSSYYQPALNVQGGTAPSPTIIVSQSPRGADLNAKSGSTYGGTGNKQSAIIGHNPASGLGLTKGYVQFLGLKLRGTAENLILCGNNDDVSSYTLGILIQDCELTDCNATGQAGLGLNQAGIWLDNCNGAIVRNNYIHDFVGQTANSPDHMSATIQWGSINCLYEYNTVVSAGSLYGKAGRYNGQYGNTVRYNFVDASNYASSSPGIGLQDWCGDATQLANGLGATNSFHHNILIAGSPMFCESPVDSAARMQAENVEVYNNTFILAASDAGLSPGVLLPVWSPVASFYNNAVFPKAGVTLGSSYDYQGMLAFSAGTYSLLDYNVYTSVISQFHDFPNGTTHYSSTNHSPLSAWRTATGGEAHSSQAASAGFDAVETLAGYYKVTSGALFGTGKISGVSGGAACNVGAWDGTIVRIGCNF